MKKFVEVGDVHEFSKTITEKDVRRFATVSGDVNPIHLDKAFARETAFGERIVHGMLLASFISSGLANALPGIGAIYLGQSLVFKRPVFLNDTVLVRLCVENVRTDKPIVTLQTTVSTSQGVAVDGQATLKMPPHLWNPIEASASAMP